MQIRGGRGYETAESLKARGERPVAVEQQLRDMRINRIFEGSTEIMHLLIAREAVDRHLEVAGEILEGDGDLKEKARVALQAGRFYAKWLPQLAVGEGQKPRRLRAVRRARRRTCASSSATRASSRARRSTRWAAGRRSSRSARRCSGGSSTSAPSCSRCRPRSSTRHDPGRAAPSARTRPPSWPTCSASRRSVASARCSTRSGATTTSTTTRSRSACSRAATRSSRRASVDPARRRAAVRSGGLEGLRAPRRPPSRASAARGRRARTRCPAAPRRAARA